MASIFGVLLNVLLRPVNIHDQSTAVCRRCYSPRRLGHGTASRRHRGRHQDGEPTTSQGARLANRRYQRHMQSRSPRRYVLNDVTVRRRNGSGSSHDTGGVFGNSRAQRMRRAPDHQEPDFDLLVFERNSSRPIRWAERSPRDRRESQHLAVERVDYAGRRRYSDPSYEALDRRSRSSQTLHTMREVREHYDLESRIPMTRPSRNGRSYSVYDHYAEFEY
jgi:hypothetical protein